MNARVSGSLSFSIRSGMGRVRIGPQSGMRLRAQKKPKLMFIPTSVGMVRATTRPPACLARSDAPSWCMTRSRWLASTESTFQLRGRLAATDMSAISCISSSLKRSRQPSVMNSRVVPSYSPTTSAMATTSSRAANRDGTGRPSSSSWV